MKRTPWVLASLFFCTLAIADDKAAESMGEGFYNLGIGLQAGIVFSNANVEPMMASSGRTGFKIGALLESPVIPGFLYLQPEFSFTQKGSENNHFGVQTMTKLSYLEFPLLLKIKFLLPRTRPFAMAGPVLSYLLDASASDPTLGLDRTRFSSFEFSVAFGGGVGFTLGESMTAPEAFVAVRYYTGLTNVDNTGAVGNSWKNTGFNLLGGIQF